ncbi:proliferation marker protein Ki-67 isoform X3 [Anarrhichthys ocellatus]|uniref:proliferation marker protein Ki-67 isoform X3 n=1 Tax=Anarrhichthys ocellatus TaxID=433405 RepID=UPI0012EE6B52|nr:proliferation marker protein Ki-67-like isoform X3 [Anarrhichthys ocellatus]
MPLHGKIVVIKRTGGDGTEFPLTAACLFGRKPDCDIRIQLPQVSKEHCRIDFNENKEIILTNLSSANPTLVNGEVLQQSERLKHGDVITVIDRSFRFEYPPPPTPKKRSSIGGKTETLKVLQNQHVGDTVSTETGEKVSTDPHLKDGTNHENIQRPLEKTVEMETKEGEGLQQSKTASPFNDLYQMIKKSLDVKTPRKSSASVLQTPTSRFCTPKPASVRKNDGNLVISTEDHITPKKDEAKVSSVADEAKPEAGNVSNGTPKSVKKQRRSVQVPSPEMARPEVQEAENAARSEATSPQKRIRTPPKRFTVEQISATPKSPVRRRSKEAKPAETKEQEEEAVTSPKTERLRKASPRNSGKVKETSKKRKSEELGADLLTSQMKKKRVSFGGSLCPELFDKRLPPNSPLRKGADPRRSLCVTKPVQSLLRRASAICLLQDKKTGKTPSPKAASPARGRSPTVQGRFSVSHIDTPSPVAEGAFTEQVSLVTATHLRRTCTSREAPNLAKVMRRRSGISRASMKVKNSWAEIVRFGQTKAQVAPAKKTVTKKTTKKAVSKPQTPVRNFDSHVSTGHADSPVTIVVGRAHKQKVVQPTGAAPKLVPNIALFKKNTKTGEDLTGISEMLKTPASEQRTRSVIDENDAPKTLVGGLGTSVVEPSVLNTPEETGEMMVSPLSVSSTVKDRSYNSEAVQRLFDNDQEASVVGAAPAVEDSSEQQRPDVKTTSVATPKQKPELPECLTGVKRMMKTPRQKAEPIEDLRGKLLKTPKQKPENQECLTGVKRMMATPRREAEPVDDIKVELLTTPKQKPEQQEGLTEVKRLCETPQPEVELLEDEGKPVEAPKALEASEVLVKTPARVQESEDLSEIRDLTAPKSSPLVCLTDGKRIAKTPKEKSAPVEDVVGVKRLVKTPKVKAQPVEENFGIERLVKTPRLSADAPVEDVEGVQELMEEPLTEPSAQPETNEVADQTPLDCDEDVAKELVFALEEPTDVINVPQDDKETADANEVVADLEELPSGHDDNEPSDAVETISHAAVDENLCVEKPTVDTDEKLSEEQPEVEAATIKVTEMETTATHPDHEKSVLDSTLKTAESLAADAAEHGDEAVVSAPVRGRRGKKTEATAPPAVRQSRGRNAKSQESPSEDQPEMAPSVTVDAQPQKSIPALEKPKRGRKPKPDAVEQNKVAEDSVVAVETKQQPQPPVRAKRGRTAKLEEEKLESTSAETVNHEASSSAAPLEKAVLKPKRGRKAKQPEESLAEQQDVSTSHSEDVPQADLTKEADAMETAPVTESLPEEETATSKVTEMDAAVQKRSGRGRKVKPVESNSAEEKHEAAEICDEAVVSAPVRGRRGKKTADAQPQKSIPALEKPKRGRKPKPDAVEQNKVAEDSVVAVETKQQPQPPVRAKRGRTAKLEEEKLESTSAETTKSQELAKKLKRTRKAEQDHVEPREEAIEMVVPEEADAPLVAEPVKMSEEAAKPKRGRKAAEVSSTDKVKRGTRGKRVSEEGGVTSVPEDTEEKNTSEPAAPVMKQSRARGTKTSIKNEVSQAVPAKRARRGAAALEETNAEAKVQVSEPVSTSVEPARRGRRAAAKPAASKATVTSEQAEPTEDLRKAVIEDTKRSVKWKEEFKEFEIPKVTPVKAVRGGKSKLGGQVVAESKTVPKAADRTEEEDLSDKVVEAQAVKRTRRGPKVADVTADEAESTSRVESVEAPPKTRRGRAAKK